MFLNDVLWQRHRRETGHARSEAKATAGREEGTRDQILPPSRSLLAESAITARLRKRRVAGSSDTDGQVIDRVIELLEQSHSLLFITGAGVSAESGLPTYRGTGGLYNMGTTEGGLPIEEPCRAG